MSVRKINRIKRKQSSLGSNAHWCGRCDARLVHANETCRCGWRSEGQIKKRDYYFEDSYEI